MDWSHDQFLGVGGRSERRKKAEESESKKAPPLGRDQIEEKPPLFLSLARIEWDSLV